MSRKAIAPYLGNREARKAFSCCHKTQIETVPGLLCFRASPCRPHPPTLLRGLLPQSHCQASCFRAALGKVLYGVVKEPSTQLFTLNFTCSFQESNKSMSTLTLETGNVDSQLVTLQCLQGLRRTYLCSGQLMSCAMSTIIMGAMFFRSH